MKVGIAALGRICRNRDDAAAFDALGVSCRRGQRRSNSAAPSSSSVRAT